jgi:antitoxin VapB
VRLPKEFRFEGTEVLIEKIGQSVVLTPKKKKWANVLSAIQTPGADFERSQEVGQVRDWGEAWK